MDSSLLVDTTDRRRGCTLVWMKYSQRGFRQELRRAGNALSHSRCPGPDLRDQNRGGCGILRISL